MADAETIKSLKRNFNILVAMREGEKNQKIGILAGNNAINKVIGKLGRILVEEGGYQHKEVKKFFLEKIGKVEFSDVRINLFYYLILIGEAGRLKKEDTGRINKLILDEEINRAMLLANKLFKEKNPPIIPY